MMCLEDGAFPWGHGFSCVLCPGLILGDNVWDGSARVDQQKVKHDQHLKYNLAGFGRGHSKVGK